uniref:aldo/keto reductase n=1 Tax=Streptomyces otsuchiensis TaxID=2681388 RepID=UPI003F68AA3C
PTHRTPTPASPVLGTMLFGTGVDEPTAFALLDRFVERGGRWIDTADCYAFWLSGSGRGGQSEEVIGRWLRARPGMRERVRISTKTGAEPVTPGVAAGPRAGLSAPVLREAFEGSRRRLGVDRVDLFWIHMEDRATPIEETVGTLAELTGSGLAERVGASNHPAWLVERARALAVAAGARPIDAIQLSHSYLRTRPEAAANEHPFGELSDEQLDHAARNAVEVWAYSPLLRGAYDDADKPMPDGYDHPGSRARLRVLREVAAELEVTPGQVVLAHMAGGAVPILPIVGVSRMWQLDAAFDAMELRLPDGIRARLDAAGTG